MARLVSLGADCQVAEQLKRYQPAAAPHFFDWLGAPIKQVIRIIENDFRGFLDPGALHPFWTFDTLVGVVDLTYRIDLVHDFKVFNAEELARVTTHYAFCARRFRELLDPAECEPPWFVRRWSFQDGEEDESQAVALFEMLRRRRADIRLLYLHNDPDRPGRIEGAYRSAYLKQDAPGCWEGDCNAWRYVLQDFATPRGLSSLRRKPVFVPRFIV